MHSDVDSVVVAERMTSDFGQVFTPRLIIIGQSHGAVSPAANKLPEAATELRAERETPPLEARTLFAWQR